MTYRRFHPDKNANRQIGALAFFAVLLMLSAVRTYAENSLLKHIALILFFLVAGAFGWFLQRSGGALVGPGEKPNRHSRIMFYIALCAVLILVIFQIARLLAE